MASLYAKTREAVNKELEVVKEKGYFTTTQIYGPVLPVSHTYISYTIHFINQNWELHSHCLQTIFM